MATPALQLFSINVRGLRSKRKRSHFFRLFKNLKYDIVCVQESYITEEVAEQWRKEWAGDLVFAPGTGHSSGLLILFRKGLQCSFTTKFTSSRLVVINVEINNKNIIIANAYAPQTWQEKQLFFDQIENALDGLHTPDILLCGDFNAVLDNNLDIIAGESHSDALVSRFKNMIESCDLHDAWRLFHPGVKEFTWSRSSPFIARRLDYVLCSSSLFERVNESNIVSLAGTDHRGCSIRIQFVDGDKGPGSWHFNGSLLKDVKYVNMINELILSFIDSPEFMKCDIQMRWELLKLKIKDFSIDYSKRKKVQNRHELINMYNELNDLDVKLSQHSAKAETLARRDAVKLKIELAEQSAARAAQTRAKARWIEQGEKNTKYFLSLEKARANARVMDSLINKEGSVITDQKEILKVQKEYFAELYSKKVNEENLDEKIDTFLNGVQLPRLTEQQKEDCEGLLNESEVLDALKSMKNGSSPGSDGLTTEFLKVFWNQIKNIIVPSFNAAFATGVMSSSQRKATIILIHKGKNLSRNDLNNWRPISLTNSDYKLLAKCLARRLCCVIDDLVDGDQVGYIRGRRVSSLLRLVDDVIEKLNTTNKPGLLVTLDFFHAFDCISKDFIFLAFSKFGFGKDFLNWVRVIMSDTKSCMGYNGWKSGYFDVMSGIRQGCPFSPLAFVLALELLALKIRQSDNIQGIKFGLDEKDKLKIALYADDITLFLMNSLDMRYAHQIVNSFSRISGLYINQQKSEIMWLGSSKHSQENVLNFVLKRKVKILGIHYCNDKSASQVAENWSERIGNIKRLIRQWEKRNLSIIGKIQIIKTLLISQLVYVMQAITIPESVLTEVNRLLFRFVWRKTDSNRKAFEKVKRTVMCGKLEEGGLKMIDLRQMQASFTLHWVVRLCNSSISEKWSILPRSCFSPLGGLACFFANVNASDFKGIELIKSSHWREVLLLWLRLNKVDKSGPLGKSTLLWNNVNVVCQGKVLLFEEWIKADIMFVRDVYTEGNFLTFNAVCEKVGFAPNRILQYLALRTAVLNFLRKFDGTISDRIPDCPPFHNKQLLKVSDFRSKLVELKFSEPCCVNFWRRKLNYTINKQNWECIFNSTQETRLRVLQWKILHNIYPTNILLQKMRVRDTNKCSFCPSNVDFIEHFFFECPSINAFWKHIEGYIFNKKGIRMRLDVCSILFGVTHIIGGPGHLDWVNHVILVGKMCVSIYKKRNAPYPIKMLFEEHSNLRKL